MSKKGRIAVLAGLGVGVALAKRRGYLSGLRKRLPGRRHGAAPA